MPTIPCASPPYAKPIARIIVSSGNKPALCKFSKTVVIPKPNKPSGAGFANFSLILFTPFVVKVCCFASFSVLSFSMGLLPLPQLPIHRKLRQHKQAPTSNAQHIREISQRQRIQTKQLLRQRNIHYTDSQNYGHHRRNHKQLVPKRILPHPP